MKKGEILSEVNLYAKRPAGGISPMEWDNVVGKKAIRDFAPDEMIEL
ncbi:SAF domain-containing protein [uncultured Helicobacter sp.]|nr:SAF domain-containing protein [uncultured Helicobacter sp.]